MQDNEKKPALRFKGFTDPWEQRKLGDLCVEFRSGEFISASDITETGEYPVFGGNGLRGFTDRFNHDGEYTLIGRQGALCGNVNFAVGKSYFTEHAIAVRADKKNQTRFLYYLFSTMDLGQYSGQSAQPGLAVGNLVELKSTLPDKQEQEKISGVLTALDTLITLHQRKYEKLVNIKKSMLDKMFPQNGASVPEIRFKGFTDPWEQRKFSDITFPAGEKNRDNLPLESYSITNEHGFIPQDEKFENGGTMREADKRMYYIVSPNSFAYNPARINVGSIGYQNTGKDVIISSLYEVFKTSDDVDDRLLWHWFKSPDFQKLIFQLQEGGVRLYFYYDKLCMGTVSLPSLEEQRKIGQFFDSLDTLITLHQREHIKPILEVKRVKRNE